jgi:hypothetical protein
MRLLDISNDWYDSLGQEAPVLIDDEDSGYYPPIDDQISINMERERSQLQRMSMIADSVEKALQLSSEYQEQLASHFQPHEAHALYQTLTPCQLHDISFGLDFHLETRESFPLITEDKHPEFFRLVIFGIGRDDRGHELHREIHDNMGYHFHYVKSKGQHRTNVLFTFNKNLPVTTSSPHSEPLFWEYHGSGINANPNEFGVPRRRAIHEVTLRSLNNLSKQAFKVPDKTAKQLYPYPT